MMVCGWIVNGLVANGWEYIPACRVIFFVYAVVGVIKVLLNLGLSRKVEAEPSSSTPEASHDDSTQPLLNDRPDERPRPALSIDRRLAFTVGSLFIFFGLDSFASGLASLYVSWSVIFVLIWLSWLTVQILDDIFLQAQVPPPRR